MPREDKVIYHKDSGPSFLGDGEKYTVLKYNSNRKIKKLDKIDWHSQKNKDIEVKISEILDLIDIDNKYNINFDNEYLYYTQQETDSSELFIIYMYKEKRLYIVENVL